MFEGTNMSYRFLPAILQTQNTRAASDNSCLQASQ
jgi:hypothetical protein